MSVEQVEALRPLPVRAACPMAGLAPKRPLRVALAGPDGVGKSTAIAALAEWVHEEMPGVTWTVRQWRPSWLPDLGVFLGKASTPGQKTPPRREPGRFQFIRVVYYFLDFLIGSWWKDKVRAPAGSLIVYDRCALDMYVDPVRFGLQSRWGTRLLWNLTPRPDLVILLHDTPDRIWERKQELRPEEMAAQLNTWLELVESGDVDAVVEVDCGPEEVAARLRDLIVDAMLRENGVEPRGGHAGGSLRWLAGILTGNSVSGASFGPEPAPSGATEVARFAVLPSSRNPRFLVPLETGGAATRSLDIYNAQTTRARAGKLLLNAGLRAGLAQPLLRDRCSLTISHEVARADRGGILLHEHLRQVLDCGPITCAISLGTPNRSQKPVLQIMDQRGRVAGYAKIGWNERTIQLVENEARALEQLRGVRFSSAVTPRVLHAGFWNGLYVLVQSAQQGPLGQSPARMDKRHLQFLIELHQTEVHPTEAHQSDLHQPEHAAGLSWSGFDRTTPDQIGSLKEKGFDYFAHLLEMAAAKYRLPLGDANVCTGFGHGDFAPWNIRLVDDKLLVLDWEYGGPACPPLWDLFHFHIGAAIELRNLRAADIYRDLFGPGTVNGSIREYCRALEIPESRIKALLAAYLCEALSSKLLLDGPLPSRKDQRARATLGSVLAILCRPEMHARGTRWA